MSTEFRLDLDTLDGNYYKSFFDRCFELIFQTLLNMQVDFFLEINSCLEFVYNFYCLSRGIKSREVLEALKFYFTIWMNSKSRAMTISHIMKEVLDIQD